MPDALALSTTSWGSGSLRILLLHGIGSNAAGWWRVGADLADLGWRVVAADLRGHGDSPDAPRYAIADHAADVAALGRGWDAVLGHSMGGAVAVIAQARDPGFSGRLVLQDPAIVMPEPHRDVVDRLVEAYDRPPTPDQLSIDHPRWHRRDCEAKAEALRRTGPEIVAATVVDSWPWNLLAELSAVSVPTVILGSDPTAGGIFPVALGVWLEQANDLIAYRRLSAAPHSAHRCDDAYADYRRAVIAALGVPTLRGSTQEAR